MTVNAPTRADDRAPVTAWARFARLNIAAHLTIFAVGYLLVMALGGTHGMSRFIYDAVDVPGFAAVLVALLAAIFLRRVAGYGAAILRAPVILIALIAGGLSAVGTDIIHHGFAFSMDEWMGRLQADVFLHGQLAGTVPEEWRNFAHPMFHTFANLNAETGLIASSYRPGMAALIAVFDLVGLGNFVSAFMAVASVLLIASIAKKLWPDDPHAPVVAALLLATSHQVLAASITSYAMSAQLCLNLLWLRLFLHGSAASHFAAACIGVATASLHQVHTHLFFAVAFMPLLLRPFRPGILLIYAGVYIPGHLAVMMWDNLSLGAAASGGAQVDGITRTINILERFIRVPDLSELASVGANVTRLLLWQSLALLPLLLIWVWYGRRTPILLACAASILISLLPYLLLMPDQGHGWGYRYLHGLIGCLILLAVGGWSVVRSADRSGSVAGMVGILAVLSVVIALPVRGHLMEQVVAPFAKGAEAVRNIDADVVVIDSLAIYYGQDLARNDAFAEVRPVAMILHKLTADQARILCQRYSVAYFGPKEALPYGLSPVSVPTDPASDRGQILTLLQSPSCTGAK